MEEIDALRLYIRCLEEELHDLRSIVANHVSSFQAHGIKGVNGK